MRLFGRTEPSAVEVAQVAVAKAKERQTRLATSLADAERELTQRKGAATTAALDDHSQDVEEWGAEVAAQAATCDALSTALATASADHKAAELALAAAQDSEVRAQSVAEIEALQDAMREPFEQLISAIATLLPLAKRAAVYQLDMQQVAGLLEQWSVDAPAAVEIASTGLVHHVEGIRAGTVRATLPRVEAAMPVERSAAPREVACFPLYDVKWSDHNGMMRHTAKYWDFGAPVATAERAISHGICLRPDDPKAVKLRKERGGMWGDIDRSICLDDEHPAPLPALPEKWINPNGVPRYSDVRQTASPLNSWSGTSAWIKQSPTNGGSDF